MGKRERGSERAGMDAPRHGREGKRKERAKPCATRAVSQRWRRREGYVVPRTGEHSLGGGCVSGALFTRGGSGRRQNAPPAVAMSRGEKSHHRRAGTVGCSQNARGTAHNETARAPPQKHALGAHAGKKSERMVGQQWPCPRARAGLLHTASGLRLLGQHARRAARAGPPLATEKTQKEQPPRPLPLPFPSRSDFYKGKKKLPTVDQRNGHKLNGKDGCQLARCRSSRLPAVCISSCSLACGMHSLVCLCVCARARGLPCPDSSEVDNGKICFFFFFLAQVRRDGAVEERRAQPSLLRGRCAACLWVSTVMKTKK